MLIPTSFQGGTAFEILADAAEGRAKGLARFANEPNKIDSNKEKDSEYTVYNKEGATETRDMCNFDTTEYQSFWASFGESFRTFENVGPGRKCPYYEKDVFLCF